MLTTHVLTLLAGAAQAAGTYVPPDTPRGSGPSPAIMRHESTLATHTVYRPAQLDGAGPLPIVAWGNGACVNTGNAARYFLTEIASHGFMVISIGPPGSPKAETPEGERGSPAPGSPAARQAAAPTSTSADGKALPAAYTTAAQLTEAIDWALAEHRRAGSPYYGKLDPNRIAVMGYSCGGLQATAAARDPRVSVLGIWNSGLFDDAQVSRNIAAADVGKDVLPTLKVASIYVTGNATDIAYKNADDDFVRVTGPTVRLWHGASGHGGTYHQPNGGAYAKVATAFLQWRLKGDAAAARQFTGPACALCKDPEWHLRTRNID